MSPPTELPPLEITAQDELARMDWEIDVPNVHTDHVPASWFACRERQLLSALEKLAAAETKHVRFLVAGGPVVMASEYDAMRARAEAAEARVAELELSLEL